MIPDSLAPGIVIRAPDKTSARESGDEASNEIVVAKGVSCILARYRIRKCPLTA